MKLHVQEFAGSFPEAFLPKLNKQSSKLTFSPPFLTQLNRLQEHSERKFVGGAHPHTFLGNMFSKRVEAIHRRHGGIQWSHHWHGILMQFLAPWAVRGKSSGQRPNCASPRGPRRLRSCSRPCAALSRAWPWRGRCCLHPRLNGSWSRQSGRQLVTRRGAGPRASRAGPLRCYSLSAWPIIECRNFALTLAPLALAPLRACALAFVEVLAVASLTLVWCYTCPHL